MHHIKIKFRDLRYIIARNLFILTNGVIFSVVLLLIFFGDTQAGIFLGIISVINVIAGLVQDLRAWLQLEKLQLLTAPHIARMRSDETVESVLVEDLQKGDRIQLRIGDQVPCDSVTITSQNLEINDGLITGESDSVSKKPDDHLLAGSIVTSGTGILRVEEVFVESRIARMTEGIKRYSINLSPIQRAINTTVKYAGYLLLFVIIFIVVRGILVDEPRVQMINNIGALSSVLVPAGLVFAITLFFSYGAAHLFRRQVLLKEVNATEKLGRIKNLCMDKTGTLTENSLAVEDMFVPETIDKNKAEEVMRAYIEGTQESSQTIVAIKKYIPDQPVTSEIESAVPFSSWRRFGIVTLKDGDSAMTSYMVGPADVFLSRIEDQQEKNWVETLLETHAQQGKHLLMLVRSLSQNTYAVIAVFVFSNTLREGIQQTVDFFQDRGVHIRIISGDNLETVRAIAGLAGVRHTEHAITGPEMVSWNESEYRQQVRKYSLFAKILPEQKEKIIEALKYDGFTAMVGDGANDALAIKKADLGIAMFDGAPATRQLASVVLMNNSFAALPGGVVLADSVIRSTELFASVFLNASFAGFYFFIEVSVLGYAFPLSALNMAFNNYVAIGIPGILISYWIIVPKGKTLAAHTQSFFRRIFPFAMLAAFVQGIGLFLLFLASPESLRVSGSHTLILFFSILTGYTFFLFAPKVFIGALTKRQGIHLALLGFCEFVVVASVYSIQPLADFFDVQQMVFTSTEVVQFLSITVLTVFVQFGLAGWFVRKNNT